jgi:hypothetical protein
MVASDTCYEWQRLFPGTLNYRSSTVNLPAGKCETVQDRGFRRWVTLYQMTRSGFRTKSRTAHIGPTQCFAVRSATWLYYMTPRPIPNVRPLPISCSQLIQVQVNLPLLMAWRHMRGEERRGVQIHVFLTLALDGCKWSTSLPGRFITI